MDTEILYETLASTNKRCLYPQDHNLVFFRSHVNVEGCYHRYCSYWPAPTYCSSTLNSQKQSPSKLNEIQALSHLNTSICWLQESRFSDVAFYLCPLYPDVWQPMALQWTPFL